MNVFNNWPEALFVAYILFIILKRILAIGMKHEEKEEKSEDRQTAESNERLKQTEVLESVIIAFIETSEMLRLMQENEIAQTEQLKELTRASRQNLLATESVVLGINALNTKLDTLVNGKTPQKRKRKTAKPADPLPVGPDNSI